MPLRRWYAAETGQRRKVSVKSENGPDLQLLGGKWANTGGVVLDKYLSNSNETNKYRDGNVVGNAGRKMGQYGVVLLLQKEKTSLRIIWNWFFLTQYLSSILLSIVSLSLNLRVLRKGTCHAVFWTVYFVFQMMYVVFYGIWDSVNLVFGVVCFMVTDPFSLDPRIRWGRDNWRKVGSGDLKNNVSQSENVIISARRMSAHQLYTDMCVWTQAAHAIFSPL